MIREIVKQAANTYVLNLPDEMVGKTIEVVAFEIEENKVDTATETLDRAQRLEDIRERYAKYPRTSHENYKFDRDEANDFD